MAPSATVTIILVAALLSFALGRVWYIWWQLEHFGRQTQARVLVLRQEYRNKKVVTYEYDASMASYQKTVQISNRTFSRLRDASFVDIKYLPDNPRVSLIVGDNTERDMTTVILLILMVGIVFLPFYRHQ